MILKIGPWYFRVHMICILSWLQKKLKPVFSNTCSDFPVSGTPSPPFSGNNGTEAVVAQASECLRSARHGVGQPPPIFTTVLRDEYSEYPHVMIWGFMI